MATPHLDSPLPARASHATIPARAAIAQHLIDAWNTHDTRQVERLYTADCEVHDVGLAQPLHGPEGVRRATLFSLLGFPDLRFTLVRTAVDGNCVVFEWSAQGTQRGKVMGIPPTNRAVTMTGVTWLVLRGDQILSARRMWDVAAMLRQMGLLPDLPQI